MSYNNGNKSFFSMLFQLPMGYMIAFYAKFLWKYDNSSLVLKNALNAILHYYKYHFTVLREGDLPKRCQASSLEKMQIRQLSPFYILALLGPICLIWSSRYDEVIRIILVYLHSQAAIKFKLRTIAHLNFICFIKNLAIIHVLFKTTYFDHLLKILFNHFLTEIRGEWWSWDKIPGNIVYILR